MSSTETTLVTISAVLALGLDVPADENLRFVVIFVLAAAMGIRNAAVRDLAVKDLTTTVLTMTLTGLFADSTPGGPPGTSAFRRVAAWSRCWPERSPADRWSCTSVSRCRCSCRLRAPP